MMKAVKKTIMGNIHLIVNGRGIYVMVTARMVFPKILKTKFWLKSIIWPIWLAKNDVMPALDAAEVLLQTQSLGATNILFAKLSCCSKYQTSRSNTLHRSRTNFAIGVHSIYIYITLPLWHVIYHSVLCRYKVLNYTNEKFRLTFSSLGVQRFWHNNAFRRRYGGWWRTKKRKEDKSRTSKIINILDVSVREDGLLYNATYNALDLTKCIIVFLIKSNLRRLLSLYGELAKANSIWLWIPWLFLSIYPSTLISFYINIRKNLLKKVGIFFSKVYIPKLVRQS